MIIIVICKVISDFIGQVNVISSTVITYTCALSDLQIQIDLDIYVALHLMHFATVSFSRGRRS